jgi:hypothetical protein
MQARHLTWKTLTATALVTTSLMVVGAKGEPPGQTHIVSRPNAATDGWLGWAARAEAVPTAQGLRGPGRGLTPEWTYAIGAATLSAPRIADVDGDGIDDIVVSTYDPVDPYSAGRVYVFDMNGNVLSGWPKTTVGPVPASPAVADIDNNGDLEVIVGSWYRAYVWNHDGSAYPNWPKYIGSYNSPAIADVDDDGDLEIIYSTTSKQLYVWHHDGTTLPNWPYTAPETIQSPAVADVDGDDALDIVAGTYTGPVGPDPFEMYVWELNGTVVSGWPVATSGTVKASAALGDVDNDGEVEIVGCAYHTSNNDYLYVWDAEGNLEAGWPVQAEYIRLSSPALGDLDGDGDLEIVIGGLYHATFREEVFAFDHDGTAVAGWPVILDFTGNHGNINSSPVIADIDGDPTQVEIVVKVWDNFFALHADGSIVDGFPYYLSDQNHSGTHTPSPAVGDLDHDGDVEYVFVSNFGTVAFFDEPHVYYPGLGYWPMFQHDAWNTAYLPAPLPGDINGDGCVNLADLGILLAAYGTCLGDAGYNPAADLNYSGCIDLADLEILLANYGTTCP